jgi:hypothetical protein
LIVRRLIVRVMAKIALPQRSIVTRLHVVISQIVASVVLLHAKIAHQLVTVLTVLPSMIVLIVVAVRLAARVTVIRVQPGAVTNVPRRVVNMLMLLLRNVVNSHRVLSAVIVPVMTTCRFSAQRA